MSIDPKVWLLALAGLCYIVAAVVRWRSLARDAQAGRPWILLLIGVAMHLGATVLSVGSEGGADFTYAAMGSFLAAVVMLVGTRFLAVNSPGLLLLPVGIMALLVATFALIDRSRLASDVEQRSLLFYIHVVFMSANLAAVLLASAAAGLYLVVSRQLKAASQRALRLPQLPPLGALAQRSLLVALAMQLGGVASGAVAISPESSFTIFHPTVLLALASLLLMAVVLSLVALHRISYRSMSWLIMLVLAIETGAMITLMAVPPHG